MANKNDNTDLSDDDLFIPPIPPPAKKKEQDLNHKELSEEIREKIDYISSEKTEAIPAFCPRCQKVVVIPFPKQEISDLKGESFSVYVHTNIQTGDTHSLIFEIDKDLNILVPKPAAIVVCGEAAFGRSQCGDTEDTKFIFAECKRCKQTLHLPVPKEEILESAIPKTPVVFIHENKDSDQHCIVVYLDNHFGDRATRMAKFLLFEK